MQQVDEDISAHLPSSKVADVDEAIGTDDAGEGSEVKDATLFAIPPAGVPAVAEGIDAKQAVLEGSIGA